MSLLGAMNTAISGLTAQSNAFGNISDNVANSQTIGFKRIDTAFVDFLTISSSDINVPGSVVARPDYVNDGQGSLTQTENPLSLAIAGSGFFSVSLKTGDTAGLPSFAVDVSALADGRQTAAMIADWAIAQSSALPPLVYSSADPIGLGKIQALLGRDASGALVERVLAKVACHLQAAGFARFIIAGGETSGAVVAALGVHMLDIGPQIAPGVPWTRSIGGPDLALALKSGNFGGQDFFVKAWDLLKPEDKA